MAQAAEHNRAGGFRARPLTPDTWPDLEELFGLPGGSVVRGCWCMYYRKSAQPAGPAGPENKQALSDLVRSGVVPGLIGYVDGRPAAWLSLGPREGYLKMRRSVILKPVDDKPVWSVICTFIAKPYRGRGVQHQMIAAAIAYATASGATTLEAYPVDKADRSSDDSMFAGARSLYEQAGFREVTRRSPTRIVMRLALRP
jgi:GNAT superfamily N-acetyltransferase